MRSKYIIFFLFSLFPSVMFGDDGWWIYAYEDISTLKSVFNYLALVGTDEGYLSSINLVMVAGMSFIVVYKFMDLTALPKYFVTTIALLLLTFSTKTTVHIVNVKSYDSLNPRIDNYAVVDNVPYIFAVLTSAFSSVGYNTALLVETIFSSISENGDVMETSFLKTGHLGGFKLLEKLDSIDIASFNEDGKEFTNYYKAYLNECIFHIAYAVKPSIEMDLINSNNIFTHVSPAVISSDYNVNITSENIIYDGTIMTCNSLYNLAKVKYDKLNNEDKIYVASKNLISSITSNIDGASSTITSMMNASDLTNASQKITSYVMNNGIRGAFESAWNSYGVGVSGSQVLGGYGSGLAIAQLQSQGKIKSKSASMVLPSMHSVLQAVMYVLFPLVLIVQLFTGGIKILQNFTLGLLWLEFWVPSFSVLNYFTIKEAQTQSLDKLVNTSTNAIGPDGLLTIANQNEIYNTIANQAAIAGDMFWMIPAIAGFILFASFHSLAGVASMAAGVVGKYSDSQTLEGERSKFAAYSEINEQLKRENPLYTGDVGTVSAMTTTNSNLSSASTAAANFLASGSSLGNLSPLAKANMGKGFEDMTNTSTRVNSLTGGGNISNMSTTVENNANLKASADKGSSTSVNKDSSLLEKAEKASTYTTSNNASLNSAKLDELKELGNGSFVQPLNTTTTSQAQVEVNRDYSKGKTLGDDSSKVGENTGLGLANKMKGESNAIENTSSEQQINASYMQQLKSISEGNSDFNSIMKIAQSSGKSMNQVLDDIYDYKKTLENTKNITAATNTENAKDAAIGEGKFEASKNNALSKKLNEGQLEQNALDLNAITNLEKDLTAPGVLREQARNAGMSVPEYLSTQGQSITYNTPNGEKITAMFTKDGEFVSQVREFTNKDGKLEEHSIKNNNGEKKVVKSTLDGNMINEHNVVTKNNTVNEANTVDSANNTYERKFLKDTSNISYDNDIKEAKTIRDTSIMFKDDWTTSAKTSIDINQMYKRVEGTDAMSSFRETMININNPDSVRNALSNPMGLLTDGIASLKAYYKDSNDVDGKERVNFEPDQINYLQNREENFFKFK